MLQVLKGKFSLAISEKQAGVHRKKKYRWQNMNG
jgi:hypothetical protein